MVFACDQINSRLFCFWPPAACYSVGSSALGKLPHFPIMVTTHTAPKSGRVVVLPPAPLAHRACLECIVGALLRLCIPSSHSHTVLLQAGVGVPTLPTCCTLNTWQVVLLGWSAGRGGLGGGWYGYAAAVRRSPWMHEGSVLPKRERWQGWQPCCCCCCCCSCFLRGVPRALCCTGNARVAAVAASSAHTVPLHSCYTYSSAPLEGLRS